MADFEDATAPTWRNLIDGQINLYDALRGQIDFTAEDGREYRVGREHPDRRGPAARLAPVREAHHGSTAGRCPRSLVDFGLFFFHNARHLVESGAGPYFYLPKLESHLEARLWNDVFLLAQELLGIPRGTIRATVLIETLPAAFEMEEILYELREHSSGLNAGRWDYIFSYIRTFAFSGEDHVLGDRSSVTMTTPFLRAYTELLVATGHRRGAHAIGGMAAFVPEKSEPEITRQALAKVKADKDREAADGFDGSWVAHPGLVPTCVDRLRRGARRQAGSAGPTAAGGVGDGRRPADGARERQRWSPWKGCGPTCPRPCATCRAGSAARARSRSIT